jgi:hypothetical protein
VTNLDEKKKGEEGSVLRERGLRAVKLFLRNQENVNMTLLH